MQHFNSLEEVQLGDAWVTIGSFDGVHRGHQALLQGLIRRAHAAHSKAVVVTFFPHPSVVLRSNTTAVYLTSPQERAARLGELGADVVVTLEFNRRLAETPAPDFVATLRRRLGMSHLWVGFNFALGRGREGDIPALERLGDAFGYQLHVIPPNEIDGEIVSSSLIRSVIQKGEVTRAARLLGRWYAVGGEVVPGDGRGRMIRVPTANLAVWDDQVLPGNGIYAGWAIVDGERHLAVTNVGVRPTFEEQPVKPRVEVHVLDFDQDLYGRYVSFEFVHYLRGEEKFATVEALIAQIQQDIQKTRELTKDEHRAPDLSA
jgi:riboflavin kinase/FMN adenylyltransferase